MAVGTALACGADDPAGRPGGGSAWREPASAVTGINRPPEIESVRILPEEPAPGDTVEAVVHASDPDGDKLELHFAWSAGGRALDGSSGSLELGQLAPGSAVEVRVTATDGRDETSASARAAVRNRRPVITGLTLEPPHLVPRGQAVQARAATRDADGDDVTLRYEWIVDERVVDARGDSLPTDGLVRGTEVRVRAVPSDGTHEGDAVESGVAVVVNGPPRIVSEPSGLSADGSFRYTVEARDPDGDAPLHYTLRDGPEGMHLDRLSGELVWRASPAQGGSHKVAVAVDDPRGARSVQEFELDVQVEAGQAPAAPAR
jgi:hypothetical protein